MVAEKLLLQMLIIVAPILLYSMLSDGNRFKKDNLVFTLLQCGAVFLSVAFTYQAHGFYWDLRFVPLVLTALYAGPVSGFAVFSVLLLTSGYIGGETAIYGYLSSICVLLVSIVFSKRFWLLKRENRVKYTMVTGISSIAAAFMTLFLFDVLVVNSLAGNRILRTQDFVIDALIHIIALGVAARLMEEIIEKHQMRVEILRAEKLNTMADLAGSFAHEVRNPLTVVKGFIQLLHKDAKGKEHDYLTLALSEVGRAEMIINDYLSFAKPEFNKIDEFNYKKLLAEIVSLLDPLAAKGGITLEAQLKEEDLYVVTDRNQLKQAIVNLVKNGIEATPSGGKVILSLGIHDGQADIRIRDNGRGMTEEQLSRIGTLFYTTKERGTGLGTTVAIRIIHVMKGEIQFKSELGKGTEVAVRLPASKKQAYSPQSQSNVLSVAKG
ncbi:hypothetical protein A8F94_18110 [Bacillus sp. FJAT-27225]|uniref:ATP-binding protein n=1 Tax=Bacillus sp. FJAT-27225 TaxID=1743144 RepID=UPI00080C234C|nr:ATP-binding protein [Bacillus sp. FJAT-27225]OCA83056.1 hypothetical protein A8F94_18110 [Bacillus sp. FJAT-27225]